MNVIFININNNVSNSGVVFAFACVALTKTGVNCTFIHNYLFSGFIMHDISNDSLHMNLNECDPVRHIAAVNVSALLML